jgi:hypothetical protein
MKSRNGFVSNSSSTSFVITNKTKESVDLVKFVEENPELVMYYNVEYDGKYKNTTLLEVARKKNITWKPGENKVCTFGDHDGAYASTAIGEVYDTMLREGGESRSFKWRFLTMNR